MKSKTWSLCWLILAALSVLLIVFLVYTIDPYLHFHAPLTDRYFYRLENERGQNDGIARQYDYDAVIIGTSMTRNFRVTEADELFNADFIKIPYSASGYAELYRAMERVFHYNPDVRLVIRALDANMNQSIDDREGSQPYLYDDDPWNDISYLLNRNVIFQWVLPMLRQTKESKFSPGISSLDDYSSFSNPAGLNAVASYGINPLPAGEPVHLSEEEIEITRENILKNVASLAAEYPNTEFYYYFPPYSILLMQEHMENGTIYEQYEMEMITAELLLSYDNVHLSSFGSRTDIVNDVNNYSDSFHYERWINRLILKWLQSGDYELTLDNYQEKLMAEMEYFLNFDYASLRGQEDYENDLYAAALLNQEITGAEPVTLQKSAVDDEFAFHIASIDRYNSLAFQVKGKGAQSKAKVHLFDQEGNSITGLLLDPIEYADGNWHMVILEFPGSSGSAKVSFEGQGWSACDVALY